MLLANSLTTREVIFAYLFGPARFVPRELAMRAHDAVCKALHLDDLAFQYQTSEAPRPSGRGFSCVFMRKEGIGGYSVALENPGLTSPMRLLMSYVWPQSLEHIAERFDMSTRAVFGVMENQQERQLVLAEVRIRSHCATSTKDGLGYVRERVLRLSPSWLESLGQSLTFASAKLDVAPGPFGENPLASPKRELTIEVLREDPASVYFELMSQWSHVPDPLRPAVAFDTTSMRSIDESPRAYIEDASEYLRQRVAGLQESSDD